MDEDIVLRLRDRSEGEGSGCPDPLLVAAVDEVERLRAENATLREVVGQTVGNIATLAETAGRVYRLARERLSELDDPTVK